MAEMQQHKDRPAAVLSWEDLHAELENAAIDYGADEGEAPVTSRRITELQREIRDRSKRADLAFPGAIDILEGRPL
jgi:hypothetical protein